MVKAILVILLALVSTLHASDYAAEYAELKAKVGKDKMDQFLTDWRTKQPGNPDAWIHSANWALESASTLNIRGKDGARLPQGEYKMEMRNGKMVVIGADGKPVGEIGGDRPTAAGAQKAADFLIEALKKWPQRADIHCGLATVYARGELWKEHMEALHAFTVAARDNAGKLRWCHDEKLTEPEEQFVAEKLHGFAFQQYQLQNKAADARFHEIAELETQACPKAAQGYNDMAAFYGFSKNWEAAQAMLQKAVAVAPDDALVWINVGDNAARLGKIDAARQAYRKVLSLKPDPALAKDAQAALDKLDK